MTHRPLPRDPQREIDERLHYARQHTAADRLRHDGFHRAQQLLESLQ